MKFEIFDEDQAFEYEMKYFKRLLAFIYDEDRDLKDNIYQRFLVSTLHYRVGKHKMSDED